MALRLFSAAVGNGKKKSGSPAAHAATMPKHVPEHQSQLACIQFPQELRATPLLIRPFHLDDRDRPAALA
jgi:hypothetical protein